MSEISNAALGDGAQRWPRRPKARSGTAARQAERLIGLGRVRRGSSSFSFDELAEGTDPQSPSPCRSGVIERASLGRSLPNLLAACVLPGSNAASIFLVPHIQMPPLPWTLFIHQETNHGL